MRTRNLDLNLLRALQVLLAERNVTRAAEILHLTQSAVSGILARLRANFDDPLLVPVGRALEPTPLARELIEPVNDLLVRIEALVALRMDFDPARDVRHFNIVASEYASDVVLAPVLRRLHVEAPAVTVSLLQPSRTVLAELDNPETDLLITLQMYACAAHPVSPLFEDSDVAVVAMDNDGVGETLTLEQFLALGQVHYQGARYGLSMFETWSQQHHMGPRRVEATVDSFHLVPALLVGTHRVATLPSRLAQRYCQELPLRIVKPLFDIPRMVEVLQWHGSREQDPGHRWLRTLIVAEAGRLPALADSGAAD
ncbi:MAG: LysR family transcriptional regulator [Steroidobacteraceae bacterium]